MQILYIPVSGRKLACFMGGSIAPRMEICGNSGLTIPMVPHLNQSNGYIKRKLQAWRVQKFISLAGADTILTSAAPQTTPCHGELYRVSKGNMRKFGPTNPQGTVCAPKQWLYEKEATGMDISKIYCPSRCRYRTYQCVAANYPVSLGVV